MKTIYTHLFFALGLISCLLAQTPPQAFKYQAVCRDANGNALPNQAVNFRIDILQGSISGTQLYSETQLDITNIYGVSNLEIGRGQVVSGSFSSISWSNGPHYISISFDPSGGNNFIPLGTQELLSVPYALFADSSNTPGPQGPQGLQGPQGVSITNTWVQGDSLYVALSNSQTLNTGHVRGPAGSGFNNGTAQHQILYWDGSAWVTLNPGSLNQVLTLCAGGLTWTHGGHCPGAISTLSCGTSTDFGILTAGIADSAVSSFIPYTGGNGGPYSGQTVNSTGVIGLTATLNSGSFVNGNGSLSYSITGIPLSSGTASFAISIGGQSCILTRAVSDSVGSWRQGFVHCSSPTQVVPITNPATNKTWMDRNLGASQVATDSSDVNAYGDLYQWGRFGDGHQCRNTSTTSTLSTSDTPGHAYFIRTNNALLDWRTPQNNNLWQGVNGINNPCPTGYRLPTEAEFFAEHLIWSNSIQPAFSSPLKLPSAGSRIYSGSLNMVGTHGNYWTATIWGTFARSLYFYNIQSHMRTQDRGLAYSVRCIKD